MKKYFAYIRVSTVKQGERGSSLVEQKSAIEAYAARYDLSVSAWFEEMETAAKQGRSQFTRMLSGLRDGKADGLIIHKIDRSARNLRDWADLGDLIDRGVDVRFVSDNFDLLSRGGRLSADIQAVVAADYIRNLRDEVKKGMYGRLKQGIYPFAAPVGYVNNGKGKPKTVDPVKGPLVKHLFERYATNTVGFDELRHELADMGLRTAAGKPFYPNSLTLILNNPFYIGVIRLGTTGETFPGAHEPLITKALFERVQMILRGKTVPRAKKHQYLLRQMVHCGSCGRRTLTGERQKSFVYYRCHACTGVSWRADVLEDIALHHIARVRFGGGGVTSGDIGDIGDVRDLVEEEYRAGAGEAERLKASLTLRLQRLDDLTSRLTDLLIDGALDQPTFNERKEKLLMNRRDALDQLERLKKRSPLEEIFEEFERNNRELLRYELLEDDEKRELIDIVCSNFSVFGKEAVFTLRSPYAEIAEMNDLDESPHDRDEVRTNAKEIFEILKFVADRRIGDSHPPASPQCPPCPRSPKEKAPTDKSAQSRPATRL